MSKDTAIGTAVVGLGIYSFVYAGAPGFFIGIVLCGFGLGILLYGD